MKQDVAYLRVSTEVQTEKYGLDLQEDKIKEYCEKNEVVISKWYVDGGYSGAKLKRPDITRLLIDAESGAIRNVYVYKLDRISRDTIDTLNLLYKVLPGFGVKIISVTEDIRTETPMDKVMITMTAAMNQYERENIKMRMNAGALERAKKGLWHGSTALPYGYGYDRNTSMLYVKEDEAENVKTVFRLCNSGLSCSKIASMVFGNTARKVLVSRILRRPIYIGLMTYKGETYKGCHEPIIDEEIYYEAQKNLQGRRTNDKAFNNYQLSGLLWCGVCGARMHYKKQRNNKNSIVCYSAGICEKPFMRRTENCPNSVRATVIESELESQIKEFTVSVKNESVDKVDNVGVIQKSIDKANNKIKKFYDLYVDNPTDNLMELIKSEEDNVKNLKKQLSEEEANISKDKSNQKALKEIERVADVWDTLTDSEKSRIYKKCVDKIIITPNGKSWDIEVRWSLR